MSIKQLTRSSILNTLVC